MAVGRNNEDRHTGLAQHSIRNRARTVCLIPVFADDPEHDHVRVMLLRDFGDAVGGPPHADNKLGWDVGCILRG